MHLSILFQVSCAEILKIIARSVAKVFYTNVAEGDCGFLTALLLKHERLVFWIIA